MYLFRSLTAIQRTGQDWPAGSTPFACYNESSVEKGNGKASVRHFEYRTLRGQNEKGYSCKREPVINIDRLFPYLLFWDEISKFKFNCVGPRRTWDQQCHDEGKRRMPTPTKVEKETGEHCYIVTQHATDVSEFLHGVFWRSSDTCTQILTSHLFLSNFWYCIVCFFRVLLRFLKLKDGESESWAMSFEHKTDYCKTYFRIINYKSIINFCSHLYVERVLPNSILCVRRLFQRQILSKHKPDQLHLVNQNFLSDKKDLYPLFCCLVTSWSTRTFVWLRASARSRKRCTETRITQSGLISRTKLTTRPYFAR